MKRNRARFYHLLVIICIIVLVVAACWALGHVSMAIYVLLISLFLVFIFHRLVDWLNTKHIPRGFGVIICYLLLLGILTLIGCIIGPAVNSQLTSFFTALPSIANDTYAWLQDTWSRYGYLFNDSSVQSWISSFGTSLSSWVSKLASSSATGLITIGKSAINTFITIFFSFVAAYWFLVDYHRIGHEFHVVVGPKHLETVSTVVSICGRCVGGYLKGMVVASICTGTIAGILFNIIGLPYATVMGVVTGLMNFVPVVGPWIAGILAAIIGLTVSPFVCIMSIVITFCAQQFTDTFITPKVMSSTVALHPALVIVAIAAGMSLGGFLGMVLAVPVTAAAKGVFVYFFERRTGRELASDAGALFKGRLKVEPVTDDVMAGTDADGGVYATETEPQAGEPPVGDPADEPVADEAEPVMSAAPPASAVSPASSESDADMSASDRFER